jgi:hypothetical protein
VTVGYNHEPAEEGPVIAAVRTHNITALLAALDEGEIGRAYV